MKKSVIALFLAVTVAPLPAGAQVSIEQRLDTLQREIDRLRADRKSVV